MSDAIQKPATAEQRTALDSMRHSLLRLHKTLLDAERIRYERQHGRIEDGYPLLNKVMNDPAFAWLRALSALIVQIDESLENEELTQTAAGLLQGHIRSMITPSETGGDFQKNYHRTLQESPAAVLAHREANTLLSSWPAPGRQVT